MGRGGVGYGGILEEDEVKKEKWEGEEKGKGWGQGGGEAIGDDLTISCPLHSPSLVT